MRCMPQGASLSKTVLVAVSTNSFTGFPGADSDIYGNIIRYCADDAIEADGGGMNVRIWGNYIDGTSTVFSFSPLSLGPVYLSRNVIERGGYGITEKEVSSHIVKTQSAGTGTHG